MMFTVTTINRRAADPIGSGALRIEFEKPTSEQGTEDRRDLLTAIFRVDRRYVMAATSQIFYVVVRP